MQLSSLGLAFSIGKRFFDLGFDVAYATITFLLCLAYNLRSAVFDFAVLLDEGLREACSRLGYPINPIFGRTWPEFALRVVPLCTASVCAVYFLADAIVLAADRVFPMLRHFRFTGGG